VVVQVVIWQLVAVDEGLSVLVAGIGTVHGENAAWLLIIVVFKSVGGFGTGLVR